MTEIGSDAAKRVSHPWAEIGVRHFECAAGSMHRRWSAGRPTSGQTAKRECRPTSPCGHGDCIAISQSSEPLCGPSRERDLGCRAKALPVWQRSERSVLSRVCLGRQNLGRTRALRRRPRMCDRRKTRAHARSGRPVLAWPGQRRSKRLLTHRPRWQQRRPRQSVNPLSLTCPFAAPEQRKSSRRASLRWASSRNGSISRTCP